MLIGEILSISTAAQPEKLAIVAGEQKLTYRELNETANQVANAIIGKHPISLIQTIRRSCISDHTGYINQPTGPQAGLASAMTLPMGIPDHGIMQPLQHLLLHPSMVIIYMQEQMMEMCG